MEKILTAIKQMEGINKAYEISNEDLRKLSDEMSEAKVTTPIIGRFSSGKSALINTLLGSGKKLLKEDILPETAVPAEIVYEDSNEKAVVYYNNGSNKELSLEDYRRSEFSLNDVKLVRLNLKNPQLSKFASVMLVDMPGFESGYDVHNKAIDNYVSKSMVYIIAFPADDMILKESAKNILKALKVYDIPICVVITKCDKANDEFDKTLDLLKTNFRKLIGDTQVTFCKTSSYNKDAEELKSFLIDLQEKSDKILKKKFCDKLRPIIENTESVLKGRLEASKLTESQLVEKEEKLKEEFKELNEKFSGVRSDFGSEIKSSISEIKEDVQRALQAEEQQFVSLVLNKQGIQEHLNMTVKNAVSSGVKTKLNPKIERYVRTLSKTISGEEVGEIQVPFYFDIENSNKEIMAAASALTIGFLIGLPILSSIAVALGGLINAIIDAHRREQTKNEIRAKLNGEVYPQVLSRVEEGLERVVQNHVDQINETVENEFSNKKASLEKMMEELKKQINDDREKKDKMEKEIQEHLNTIGEIKNALL